MWWAIVTMTTVGYGDPPVTTDEGRVLGICLMLLGTGLVALFTGAVAQRFLASDVDRAVRAGHDMGDELEATERAPILAEISLITTRFKALETSVQRLASSSKAPSEHE